MITTIQNASHIVLVAHEHPDADSLGSASAFYSYLLRLQKKVTLFCSTSIGDENLFFLPWSEKIRHTFPHDADLVVSFDCGNYKRLGIVYEGELINFDHHISNECYGTYNCIDPNAFSTTQVLYGWFVANDIKINAKMALSLYAGLMDDTNCFGDGQCNGAVFTMAKELVEFGANHEMCINALYNSRSLASLRLKGIMLSQMKILGDGQIALFEVSQKMLETTGAYLRDCKVVVDEALSLKTVRAAVLVAELKRGGVKISLRSDGILNASEVASVYGGGGHNVRAGARIAEVSIDDAVEKIMKTIKGQLK